MRSLSMLIRYVGEHPHRIDLIRTDPQASDDGPEMIRSLLDG